MKAVSTVLRVVKLHQKQFKQFGKVGYEREIEEKFGQDPEDYLFTKSLKEQYKHSMHQKLAKEEEKQKNLQQLKQDLEIEVNVKEEQMSPQLVKRVEQYPVTQKKYIQYQQKNPYGKVNIIQYNNSQITLVGTQYQFLPIKNVYKLLKYSKPDVICLQIRPDQVLNNFLINIKRPGTEFFSSSRYMRQIVKQGFDIMPSQLYRDKVKQHLLNNKIYLQQISNKDEEYYEQYQEQIKKTYKEYSHLERLSLDTIATACFYAERNNIPIVLCDQPEEIFRQDIANSNTLMQLQNIFTRCSRQIALEPDLQPQNPLSVAFSLFPEQFLGQSDQYISTVLQYLSAKKINKITALLGNVQSESIEEILENRKIGHLADFLKPSNVQHSLVRDITSEEIIEKHAILDTMYYGKDIFNNFDQKEFHTTYEMINRYGDPQYIDRSRLNRLRQIHFDCLKKYQRFAEQEFSEGKNQLKREFMKKVGYAL